jgi:hypothetical protein
VFNFNHRFYLFWLVNTNKKKKQQKTKEKSLITSCYTNVQKLLTKKKGRASKLSSFSLFYLFTKATLHTYKQPTKKKENKRTAQQ